MSDASVRCVCPSAEAFVSRIAHLGARGYHRIYFRKFGQRDDETLEQWKERILLEGRTPPTEEQLHELDAKMVAKYDLSRLRSMNTEALCRRKANGLANVTYFRHRDQLCVQLVDSVFLVGCKRSVLENKDAQR